MSLKTVIIFLLALSAFQAVGQDRIELGYQTTRRGIVWYQSGKPTHQPNYRLSRDTNAVLWVDTLTALRYDWDYRYDRWRAKGTTKSALPPLPQQTSGSAIIDNTTAFWIRDTFNLLHKYDSTAQAWTPVGDFMYLAAVPTNISAGVGNGAAIYTRSLWQRSTDYIVHYWDGSAWLPIGSVNTDTSGYNLALTTSGDTLYLTDGNGTLSVDLDGVGLPPGTNTQTLRHNGTGWVANSTLTNDGTNIGVNAAPSASYKVFVKQSAAQDGVSVENSAGTGDVQFYHQTSEGGLRTTVWPLALRSAGILSMYGPGGTTPGHIQIGAQSAVTTATNNAFFLRFNPNYAPTASGGNIAMLRMVPTINQTGSANGDIYLFDAIPTITNLTGNLHGYRYSPSVGRAIWQPNGSTSVISHHAGKFGFGSGSDAPAQTIHVQGTARITGSDGTPTTIMGRDADGDVSAVGIGSNLSISGGNLSANDTSGYNLAFAISGDTLRITDADGFLFVDLSDYMDNTDTSGFNRSLYISGDTLYIQDDNSTKAVSLAPYINTDTDNQNLTYAPATGIMSISGGAGDTIPVMIGATSGTAGERGLVGKPSAGDEAKFWRGDGTWSNPSTGGDNWGSQVVQVTARLSGNGTGASPLDIAQQGATSGQVLKWNGTSWVPQNDNDTAADGSETVVTAGTGIGVSGSGTAGSPYVVSNTGDLSATNEIQNLSYAPSTGIMSISGGTGDTVNVMVGATSGVNGERGLVPRPVAGEQGAFLRGDGTWANPSVGGDNWGSQVVQVTARLSGNGTGASPLDIAQQGATSGQALKWNGTSWAPANDNDAQTLAIDSSAISTGQRFSLAISSGNTVYFEDEDRQQVDTFTYSAGVLSLSVQRDGQPAKTVSIPVADGSETVVSSGTGIGVSGSGTTGSPYVVSNTGDLSATNEGIIGVGAGASNTATITSNSSGQTPVTVAGLTGISISETTSANGGTINITNTSPDQVVVIAQGPGILVAESYPNFTITAIDTSFLNEIQSLAIDSSVISAGQRFALSISSANTVYFEDEDRQQVDTFRVNAGNVELSVQRDGQPVKTIPVTDIAPVQEISAGSGISVSAGPNVTITNNGDLSVTNEIQQIDTFTIVSNALRASLSSDGVPFKSVDLTPYLDNTDSQTLAIDSSAISTGQRFALSISGGNTVYFEDEDRQQVDTFTYSAGVLSLSVQRDGQPAKTVSIPVADGSETIVSAGTGIGVSGSGTTGSPYVVSNTGDLSATNEIQQIDTFSIVSNVLRASLSSDGVPFKSVDLAPYLDNTDSQNLSYAPSTGIMSISGGTGDTVNVMVGATSGVNGERGLVPRPVAGEHGAFLRGDGTWANPSVGGDNWGSQVVQVTARLSGNGTGASPLDIAQQSATSGQALKWNGTSWAPANDNDTDAQTLAIDSSAISAGQRFSLAISSGNTVYFEDEDRQQVDTFRVNAGNVELSVQRDAQPVKTIPVTSIAPVQAIAAGTGISVSGTSTITVTNTGDLSNTNEIQQIDTFTIVSNVLRASLSSDGVPFKSVDLTPYVNEATNLTYSGSSSPVTLSSSTGTDVTTTAGTGISLSATFNNLTITNTAPDQTVSITNGGGIAVSGTYPAFTLTASDQSATNEIQQIDTFSIVSNVLRASLSSDGVPFKSVDLTPYLDNTDDQKADTFALVGNVIRLSLESDNEPFKSVDLTPLLTGGLNGIYGNGTAGTGSDTLPPGGSVVTIPGQNQPLQFNLRPVIPATNPYTGIEVNTNYSADDAVSRYFAGTAPADSIEIYNFDNQTYIKETGGNLNLESDRNILLVADSVSATAPTRTIAPFLIGQSSDGYFRKIAGASSGQIMKWDGTNWALAADNAGAGTLDGAENGLNVVSNKVRLGGTLLTTTIINQATFDMRFHNGKFSHSPYNVFSWTPTQSSGFEGFSNDPTTSVGPINDGVTEFRVRLEGTAKSNSLTLGGYINENQGWWMQSRSYANQGFYYPLQLNPRGGPVSVGRGTTIPTARFTVTATGATGSTASGMVGLFENTGGSGNVSVGFGAGSDAVSGQLMWNGTNDVMRVINRNATTGVSKISFAIGGETSDRAHLIYTSTAPNARFSVGQTAANTHSTLQSGGSIATAFRSTTTNTTITEADRTVVYTLNSTVTFTLPSASGIAGREYIIHHFGSGGNIALSSSVLSSTGTSFSAVGARQWAYIISDGTNWQGYLLQSL